MNQGFIKYFNNTSWLLAEKIFRMILGLFVGIWVAKYLGPEQFGLLSYIIAFVGLFAPLSKLGLDGIVPRDIAKNESDIDELINTSIFFRFLGSLLIVVIVFAYMYLEKEQEVYLYISVILSIIYTVKSYEIIEFYFRAKVKAKYVSIANMIAIIISSILKVLLIFNEYSLIYFAITNLIEGLVAIGLLLLYFNKETQSIKLAKINFNRGVDLIKESWPLIFGGFFALVYLNIDQVMLEEILGSYIVGQYSAAVRISSLWYYIPIAVGWSIQTAIVNAKKHNENLYYKRLQMLFTLMALIAYVLIVPISFFADEIINILFGQAYNMAGSMLAIHIIASLFVFVGSIRALWVTNESYFKFALFATLGAGVINVILNLLWIPQYGGIGAAWATLISYAFSYVVSGFLFVPARKVAVMQIKSILLVDIYNQYKNTKKCINDRK